MKISILGAESTGKTELTLRLAGQFEANGKRVCLIPEVLHDWCISHVRTPRQDEQLGIAQEQAKRVHEALGYDMVLADTTPLMIAIYSDLLFDDRSLYDMALEHQRSFDLTLVTGLDLPWVADGLQRDGPHVREPVDALLRDALAQGNIPYHVVYGSDALRTENALKCIASHFKHAQNPASPPQVSETPAGNRWLCERCSDPECEHRLFTSLLL